MRKSLDLPDGLALVHHSLTADSGEQGKKAQEEGGYKGKGLMLLFRA